MIGGVAVQQVDRCESKRMSFSLSAIFFSYGVNERGTGCLSTCGHDGCLSPDEDDSSSLTFIIKHHSEAAKLSACEAKLRDFTGRTTSCFHVCLD